MSNESEQRTTEQRFLAEQIRLAQENLKTWPKWLRPRGLPRVCTHHWVRLDIFTAPQCTKCGAMR